MKARQQSLHDERRQSRALQEAHSKELDDVRVAEGAHQLAFTHELGHCLGNLVVAPRAVDLLQKGVDGFSGGADGYGHLVDSAVGSTAYSSASELHVGEHERPQLRVGSEKSFRHFFFELSSARLVD